MQASKFVKRHGGLPLVEGYPGQPDGDAFPARVPGPAIQGFRASRVRIGAAIHAPPRHFKSSKQPVSIV
jgi:hypothetical protein